MKKTFFGSVNGMDVHAYCIENEKLKVCILDRGATLQSLLVKDKGVGIPDIEQARRPAYTTGGADRSGMGFTIMESFMTDLDITSEPGKGTTVHMRRKLQRRK